MFRRSPGGDLDIRPVEVPGTATGRVRIRCPRCGFEPRKEDLWSCVCGHRWNTFDTGGVCPACAYVWEYTACPRCEQWSRHQDWYVWGGGTTDRP